MSKTQVEVVFGFIGEELAGTPIPSKAAKKPSAVRPGERIIRGVRPDRWVMDEYTSLTATEAALAFSSRTYPIKQLQVSVQINDDFQRRASEKVVMTEVLTQLAYQLAAELVPLLKVERRYDVANLSTLFCATLQVVDPSVKGDKIVMPEAGAIRGAYGA